MNDTEIQLHGATVKTESFAVVTINHHTETYSKDTLDSLLLGLQSKDVINEITAHYHKSQEDLKDIFTRALKLLEDKND